MHTTNLQVDGDDVDEIPAPVVVDQILHKRVIMSETWIVSESPCTDQLEHRTETQPDPKKSTCTEVVSMTDEISGEDLSDINEDNYDFANHGDDDNSKNVQNDDNRKEFEQFLLWRQNGKPAVKTSKSKQTSSKTKTSNSKSKPGKTSSKSKSEGSGGKSKKNRAHFDSALSGSEDD